MSIFGVSNSDLQKQIQDLSENTNKQLSLLDEKVKQAAYFSVHQVLCYTGVIITFTVFATLFPALLIFLEVVKDTVFFEVARKCNIIAALAVGTACMLGMAYFVVRHGVETKRTAPLLLNNGHAAVI